MKRKNLTNILLGLAIIFFFLSVYFVLTAKNRNDVFFFNYKPFIITTGSMEPEYPVNSLVIIQKDDPNNVKVGDPIAFHSDAISGQIAFHRVVDITNDGFVTKGDNNSQIDDRIVTFDNFVGKKVFMTTFTVWLFSTFTSPTKVIFTIIIPLVAIILILIALRLVLTNRKKVR